MPDRLTLRETMVALGCSRSSVWRMIRDGRLHPTKVGPRRQEFAVEEVKMVARVPEAWCPLLRDVCPRVSP